MVATSFVLWMWWKSESSWTQFHHRGRVVRGGHGVLIKGYGDDLDGDEDDLNNIRMTMTMVMMRRIRLVSGGHGELIKGSVMIQILMPGLSNHDHDNDEIFMKMVRCSCAVDLDHG